MDLNDRKKKILQAVIDEYIGTAEPVGSRAISKKKDLGLSSATIRNEMADLEEMGYLVQPHTSAGRIPSDEGYRFYVSSLMRRYSLGMEALQQLQEQLRGRVSKLDSIIKKASLITSSLTNYATIISTPSSPRSAKIQKIDLVSVEGALILLVITDTGGVRHEMLRIPVSAEQADILSAILNSKLGGLSADEIDYDRLSALQAEIGAMTDISPPALIAILHFVCETAASFDDKEIYLTNAKSILSFPEYSDVGKAKKILDFLEDKKNLGKLLGDKNQSDEVTVKIGSENEFDEMKDCSLVTVNYELANNVGGKIGVIGPKRMNYARVFASLDIISKEIDNIIAMYLEGE